MNPFKVGDRVRYEATLPKHESTPGYNGRTGTVIAIGIESCRVEWDTGGYQDGWFAANLRPLKPAGNTSHTGWNEK